jgi:hypothetical protein
MAWPRTRHFPEICLMLGLRIVARDDWYRLLFGASIVLLCCDHGEGAQTESSVCFTAELVRIETRSEI